MSFAALHRELDACRRCKKVVGPVIHGPVVRTKVMLIGQAPGPHEFKVGRPFGWTAGKTLFKWFGEQVGIDEATFRDGVYISAVARCFPGKAKGGGDRVPDREEMENCRPWIEREVALLKPKLIIPVGALAISQVLGRTGPLVEFIGQTFHTRYLKSDVDVIALPHPSGASTWHRMQPGVTLLGQALRLLKRHPAMQALQADSAARRSVEASAEVR